MTSQAYCTIIHHTLLPYVLGGPFPNGCFTFQHDQSPIPTARAVRQPLDDRAIPVMPWSPGGADMNITRNVWGILNKRLSRRVGSLPSSDTLWDALRQEWDNLRQTVIANELYGSLPRRMVAGRAAGNFTKYKRRLRKTETILFSQ